MGGRLEPKASCMWLYELGLVYFLSCLTSWNIIVSKISWLDCLSRRCCLQVDGHGGVYISVCGAEQCSECNSQRSVCSFAVDWSSHHLHRNYGLSITLQWKVIVKGAVSGSGLNFVWAQWISVSLILSISISLLMVFELLLESQWLLV